jgi:hypothetical protein
VIARHEPGGRGSAGPRSPDRTVSRDLWLSEVYRRREVGGEDALRRVDEHLTAAEAHLRSPAFGHLQILAQRARVELAKAGPR